MSKRAKNEYRQKYHLEHKEENKKLKEIIDKSIKCIDDYACIDDNYNKIYSVEEKDLLKILKGE